MEGRQVESIELHLENCENISIKKNHIGFLDIKNVSKSIARRALNSVSEEVTSSGFAVEISAKANVASSYSVTWEGNETKPFERIRRQSDIVGVQVQFDNGEEEYILLPWNGESDADNSNQKTIINEKTGDLYVVVNEFESLESVFSNFISQKENPHWGNFY